MEAIAEERNEVFTADDILSSHGLPTSESDEWKAFLSICTLYYFERLWIIQEIRLAKKVVLVWGETELQWECFYTVLHFFMRNDLFRQDNYRCDLFMPAMKYLLPFVITNDGGLLGYIWWTRLHKCSDPRDRIFAILALWSKLRVGQEPPEVSAAQDSDLLVADYSLTINEVMCTAARLICKDDLRLKILSFVHHKQLPDNNGLPSWVPVWGSTSNSFQFESAPRGACNGFAPLHMDFEEGYRLVTHGILFDEVEAFSGLLGYTSDESENFTALSPGSKRVEAFWDNLRIRRESGRPPQVLDGESTGIVLDDMIAFIRCLKRDFVFEKSLKSKTLNSRDIWGVWIVEILRFAKWQLSTVMQILGFDDEWSRQRRHLWIYQPAAAMQAAYLAREMITALEASPLPIKNYDVTEADLAKFVEIVEGVANSQQSAAGSATAILETNTEGKQTMLAQLCDAWKIVNSFEGISPDDFHFRAGIGGIAGRLFFTKAGRIGVGPGAIDNGDKICILFGGPVPYAVRPTGKKNQYLFAGECFVPGLMDGAVLEHFQTAEGFRDVEQVVLC